MLESMLLDVRHAVRVLAKSPLFTVTAVLTLALGVGANATIFSVASAMLLRPLPGLAAPDRLVDVGRTQDGRGFDTVSYPMYRDLRARTTTLQGVYAYRIEPEAMSLSEDGAAERVYGSVVSANYFEVLGARPRLGRLLRDDDDATRGGAPVAVISAGLWARRFASDPGIVGRTLTLNGRPFTVVGVAPPGFQGTTLLRADVWLPMSMLAEAVPRMSATILDSRRSLWLFMGGRLRDGVSAAQADAEVRAIAAALATEFPREHEGQGLAVKPASPVPGQVQVVAAFLGLLMAIVGLVLLTACVNVAGMLLARSVSRRREVAVRLAIGASRWRIVRQHLTETVVLFAAGGMAGLVLSRWLSALLLAVLPQLPVPIGVDVRLDARVVLFAAAVSLLAALLAGAAPALQASRPDLLPALKGEGVDGGTPRLRLRHAFVVGQVALSLVLVVAAGLFLRALQHAARIDPGFADERVDVVSLDLSLARYDEASGSAFLRDLLDRAHALPGVESVSAAVDLPLDGGRFGLGGFRIPGVPLPPGRELLSADWNVVAPGYFATLKLPLQSGRDFSSADAAGALPVAVVNRAFVERFWPGQDALGRTVEASVGPDDTARTLTVVGVTADAHLVSLGDDPEPMIYVPYAQQYMSRVNLVVRTAPGASGIALLRELLRRMNPVLPVSEALPLRQVTALGTIPQRVAAAVAGSLGAVALLLAAIGIHGVTAYTVSSRTREIGVRMALGADRPRVVRLVLRQAFGLSGTGVAVGLLLAAAGAQVLGSLLMGVPSLDPVAFAGAAALFALITALACYAPARRAAAVDPAVALRNE